MPFEKIQAKKKAVHVVEQLMKAIQSKAFAAGDKLPPEYELAEQLGVGRAAVREGLAALALQGIVSIKHGDGTYVLRVPGRVNFQRVGEDPSTISEVIEARRGVEEVNVRLACGRIEPNRLQDLERCLGQIEQAVTERNSEGYLDGTLDFHMAIAEAAKNRVLTAITQYLLNAMETYQQKRLQYYEGNIQHIEHQLGLHKDMLDQLKAKNTSKAIAALSRIFDYFEQTAAKWIVSNEE